MLTFSNTELFFCIITGTFKKYLFIKGFGRLNLKHNKSHLNSNLIRYFSKYSAFDVHNDKFRKIFFWINYRFGMFLDQVCSGQQYQEERQVSTGSSCLMRISLLRISLLLFFKTITKIWLMRFYGLSILLLRT